MSLVAVDTASPVLAARALRRCLDLCDFADAVLLTDRVVDAPCRIELIPPLPDRNAYSQFIVKQLGRSVGTDFVLVAQWDGFVVDPGAWRDDFLAYDYIGARWPWFGDGGDIGNGGFSLRSRKLFEALASPLIPPPGDVPEDLYICRILRPALEQRWGIRFAPAEIADAFSYERCRSSVPSFGFHGLFNIWRHLERHEIQDMIGRLPHHVVWSSEYVEVLIHHLNGNDLPIAGAMSARMAESGSMMDVLRHFGRFMPDKHALSSMMEFCAKALVHVHCQSRSS